MLIFVGALLVIYLQLENLNTFDSGFSFGRPVLPLSSFSSMPFNLSPRLVQDGHASGLGGTVPARGLPQLDLDGSAFQLFDRAVERTWSEFARTAPLTAATAVTASALATATTAEQHHRDCTLHMTVRCVSDCVMCERLCRSHTVIF